MALVAATGADGAALRSRFEALLSEHPEVNLQYARRLSGLDVRYPAPGDADGGIAGAADDDPRRGARVPDLVLELSGTGSPGDAAVRATGDAADGPQRLYDLLRMIGPGRFLRLTVADTDTDADVHTLAKPDEDEDVAVVRARRVLGPDWALRAGWGRAESVLIRPDGHVASISAPAGPGTAL